MHFPQIHGALSGRGSPSGRAGERSETERARPLTANPRHRDSIALTKSLPIAAQRLFPAGLALSVIASQCHLSQRERLWQGGSLSTERLRLDRTQKGGPCLRGQRLLDNAPCQAVAGPDSGALPLPRHRASLVQTKADRHANGSPFGATATTAASGGNREELLGQRPAGCERQRSRRWEPQPGLGERSETERLYEDRAFPL